MFEKLIKYAPHFTGPAPIEDAVKDVLQVVDKATIETNGGILVSHFGNKQFLWGRHFLGSILHMYR